MRENKEKRNCKNQKIEILKIFVPIMRIQKIFRRQLFNFTLFYKNIFMVF